MSIGIAADEFPILWQPPELSGNTSRMAEFMRMLEAEGYGPFSDYEGLWQWSVDHRAEFWSAMWRTGGVISSRAADLVLVDGDAMPGSRWFVGARLNFAENLLRYRDEEPAILFRGEDGREECLSYAELHRRTARLAAFLQELGIGEGDRVAAVVPNIPQAVIGMLACAWLGAAWSSCSPDFGVEGILDRFGQIRPKVLFTANGYSFKGKQLDSLERIGTILKQLPSIERVVVVPYTQVDPDISGVPNAVMFRDFIAPETDLNIEFEQLPFDHPLYILYSSGTTGKPKCIVHGQGGTLLQHLKELVLHINLRRQDRLCYYTTCGWMMWNWMVSGLATGCALVLYEAEARLAKDDTALFKIGNTIMARADGGFGGPRGMGPSPHRPPRREPDRHRVRCAR